MTLGGAGRRLLSAVLCVAAASALVAARPWLDDAAAVPPPAAPGVVRLEDVVRLHVVAHSDAEFDQAVKLAVRDRVLAVLAESGATAGLLSRDQALAALQALAPQLEAAALEVLAASGADYAARVAIGYHPYEERRYRDLVLPAGTYASVRIILGSGEGANWWCVLYPVMCSVEPLPAGWPPAAPALSLPAPAASAAGAAQAPSYPGVVLVPGGGEALLGVGAGAFPQSGVVYFDAPPALEIRIALLEWARRWPALGEAIQRLEAVLARAQPQP